jgi:hypothetical protein
VHGGTEQNTYMRIKHNNAGGIEPCLALHTHIQSGTGQGNDGGQAVSASTYPVAGSSLALLYTHSRLQGKGAWHTWPLSGQS